MRKSADRRLRLRLHDRALLCILLTFALQGFQKCVPEKLSAILTSQLLDAAVRAVCKTQIGIVPPSTTFDLASLQGIADLPALLCGLTGVRRQACRS